MIIFYYIFLTEIGKKFKWIIQSSKSNQPEFDQLGLIRIWLKNFINSIQTKPIKINMFGFIFPSNLTNDCRRGCSRSG